MLTPASRAGLLARGRAAKLLHLTNRARVLRPAGIGPLDRQTGRQLPAYRVVYTDLPFRVRGSRAGAAASRTVQVGESELQVAVREGETPHDTVLHARDLILVDTGESAGTVWHVVDGDGADGQTSLRVPITSSHLDDDWQEVEG